MKQSLQFNNKLLKCIIIFGDLCVMNLLFVLLYRLFDEGTLGTVFVHSIPQILILLNLVYLICNYSHGVILHHRIVRPDHIVRRSARNVLVHALAFGTLFSLADFGQLSLRFFVAFYVAFFICLASYRLLFRAVIKCYRRHGGNSRTIILIGSDENMHELYGEISIDPAYGFRVLGNEDRVGVGFGLVLGYKVNPALSFGFGYSVGPASTPYTTYEETSTQSDHSNATKGEENDFSEEPIQHSLFARAKYRLNDNRFSPFFAVDMGWHFFGWDDNVGSMKLEYGYGLDKDKLRKVGFFLTPAVGGSLRVAPNSYLDIRLGYELGTKAIGNAESEWTGYRSFSRTVQKGKSLSGLTIGVSFVHTLKYFSK